MKPRAHFAGVNTGILAQAVEGLPILFSYADVTLNPGSWRRHILPRLEAGAYVAPVLDSGAFSELSRPSFHVDVEAYAGFIEDHGHLFDQIVTLDDIGGDLERTWRNTERLLRTGREIIPVFHGREPWSVLRHYCAEFDRVGLGFARDRGRVSVDQGGGLRPDAWLHQALGITSAAGVETHGFAMTRFSREGGHTRLTTTDSTTWISEKRALARRDLPGPHGLHGDAALLLCTLCDVELAELAARSYFGAGPDAEVSALAELAKGQARTALRRFTMPQLLGVIEEMEARWSVG